MKQLPATFEKAQFLHQLKDNLKDIVSFIGVGDLTEWRYEYNQRVLEAFVSSDLFNSFPSEKKVKLIDDHVNLMMLLKLLNQIITQEVTANEMGVRNLIDSLTFSSK